MRAWAIVGLLIALCACRRSPPRPAASPPPRAEAPSDAPRWSDAWLLREGARYLDDTLHRRETLVASLTNPANSYSRLRLSSYGLGDRGWDALPAWNPRSVPVTREVAQAIGAGAAPSVPGGTAPLWDGRRPATVGAWVALGRAVFFGYPMRAEVFAEWGLAHPERLTRVGVVATREGDYPGLRVFRDLEGRPRVGITCALCHTAVRDGSLVVGAARRGFDYGALRLAYHRETATPVDADLARRMATWGPGRADVTEDEAEDPVAIPDLWGLRDQEALTQAGTLRHVGPAALAIRQETQLLDSNHQRVRPPRELSWALAMFLYSLEPPPRTSSTTPDQGLLARGRSLFDESCSTCHSNRSFGGEPVSARRVGTDPSLAHGGARGTGNYRPPALVRVADAAPYLHQGALGTLDALFAPERLSPDYRGSPLGPGPVVGHAYGTDWSLADRAALLAWLRTL